MNSYLLKIFAFLIVLSQTIMVSRCASREPKFDAAKITGSLSDDDIVKGTLQQVPRYLMYYRRDTSAPYYKRAVTGIDTITGYSIGKRSELGSSLFNQRQSTFESNPISSEMVSDFNHQQGKFFPLRSLQNSRLTNENYYQSDPLAPLTLVVL